LQYARDLLGALRWDGVAHLGFFVDKARKKVWCMETNGASGLRSRAWCTRAGTTLARLSTNIGTCVNSYGECCGESWERPRRRPPRRARRC